MYLKQEATEATYLRAAADIGICTSCRDGSECMNVRNLRKPILFCEDFVIDSGPEQSFELSLSAMMASRVSAEDAQGLCATCSYAQDCSLSRPQGGVWHCEEYR